jgi:hypothetical protein
MPAKKKRKPKKTRKLTLAARAKKHGVSVAKFKDYLAARRQLGREMLG